MGNEFRMNELATEERSSIVDVATPSSKGRRFVSVVSVLY